MMGTVIAAFVGTIAFSVLFSVPKRNYPACGLIGGVGWLIYLLLSDVSFIGATGATYIATVVVILLSREMAVIQKCPATLFMIPGIFPLVPGAGIYWAAYYLVTNQLQLSLSSGLNACKAAVAIVLGIVTVFEIPGRAFRVPKCFSKNTDK